MTEEKARAKILVVDDDPGVLRLVETLLAANGYDVMAVDEAAVGLELAMKRVPDLIVLDVMMPIINGFNICRLLKSEEGAADIPVILLTGRATEEDARIGQEVGATAYLSKPLDTEQLLGKIGELLGGA